MLTKTQLKSVEDNWNLAQWPDGPAYAYAKVMHSRPHQFYRDRVRHLGLHGKSVLEAGCGTGTWCFALLSAFDKVSGIDYTQERIDVANWFKKRFRLKEPSFTQGDVRALPYPRSSFDAVFCSSVLIGALEIDKVYGEIYRVLKPRGIAYIELNGLGYGYSLYRETGLRHAIGGGVVYNSLCLRALSKIIPKIRPGGAGNAAALASNDPASAVLKAIGADAEAVAAASEIEALGEDYPAMLLNDLREIAEGKKDRFSQPSTGRAYDPKELEAAAKHAGFKRFEWSHEGWLSLQPKGIVRKGPSAVAPPFSQPTFEGHLRRFETLSWK